MNWLQWFRILGIGNGVSDLKFLRAKHRTNLACRNLSLYTLFAQSFKNIQFLDF
ncbi:hypothetical protein DSECCO2_605720 [anaerobic digester metagenome]